MASVANRQSVTKRLKKQKIAEGTENEVDQDQVFSSDSEGESYSDGESLSSDSDGADERDKNNSGKNSLSQQKRKAQKPKVCQIFILVI